MAKQIHAKWQNRILTVRDSSQPIYVYRFVSAGTVKEVMYKREATKETNAKRVIDNEDIDNKVNNHETLFGSILERRKRKQKQI